MSEWQSQPSFVMMIMMFCRLPEPVQRQSQRWGAYCSYIVMTLTRRIWHQRSFVNTLIDCREYSQPTMISGWLSQVKIDYSSVSLRPWPCHVTHCSAYVGRNLWIGDIHGSACAIYGSILCAEIHGLRRYLWIELRGPWILRMIQYCCRRHTWTDW